LNEGKFSGGYFGLEEVDECIAEDMAWIEKYLKNGLTDYDKKDEMAVNKQFKKVQKELNKFWHLMGPEGMNI